MKLIANYLVTGLVILLSMCAAEVPGMTEHIDPGQELSNYVTKRSRGRRLADCSTSSFSPADYTSSGSYSSMIYWQNSGSSNIQNPT